MIKFRTAAICAVATVGVLLAGGCSDGDGASTSATSPTSPTPAPTPSGLTSNATFEDQVLTLVNARRVSGAVCGGVPRPSVGSIAMHETLRAIARAHSRDMAERNVLSHTGADGSGPADRLRAAGITALPAGENIARGQPTPQSIVDTWMASPEHCTNIMLAGFRLTGIGHAFSNTTYWTQVFTGN